MRRLQTKYRAVIGVLLFYLPFHIFLSPTYWDDATFAKMLGEYHNNLLSYTITRYETWSSRITIELVLPFLTTWPAFIWKTLNLLMIAILYFDLVWIMEHLFDLREKRTYVMTAVLLCAFPFSIMAQTGWIATTTNYLWVIALGLYAINRMLQAGLHGQSLSGREILLSALSIFYCASFESMAAILFLVELGLLLYCKKEKRKCPAVVFLCMGLTILFLLYILSCPGNRLRPVSDARYWMPEFFELTVVDRLRMGVLSSYMHFVSLPSPVFFILNMAVFFYFMGWRVLTYQVPTPLPKSMADRVEQGLLLVTVAAWFAIVLYTLFTRAKGGRPAVVILVLACLPEMAVGITPTVIASILRTMIYLYMAMIILIVALYDSGEEKWPAFGRRFLWFCMGAGVLLNACQIARHIMLYG